MLMVDLGLYCGRPEMSLLAPEVALKLNSLTKQVFSSFSELSGQLKSILVHFTNSLPVKSDPVSAKLVKQAKSLVVESGGLQFTLSILKCLRTHIIRGSGPPGSVCLDVQGIMKNSSSLSSSNKWYSIARRLVNKLVCLLQMFREAGLNPPASRLTLTQAKSMFYTLGLQCYPKVSSRAMSVLVETCSRAEWWPAFIKEIISEVTNDQRPLFYTKKRYTHCLVHLLCVQWELVTGSSWLGAHGWELMAGSSWLGAHGWEFVAGSSWLGAHGWNLWLGACGWELVAGSLWLGTCGWELVAGSLWLGACGWELVAGSLWLGTCGWELVAGSLWLGACGWELVAGSLWLGTCGWELVAGSLWLGACGWELVAGSLLIYMDTPPSTPPPSTPPPSTPPPSTPPPSTPPPSTAPPSTPPPSTPPPSTPHHLHPHHLQPHHLHPHHLHPHHLHPTINTLIITTHPSSHPLTKPTITTPAIYHCLSLQGFLCAFWIHQSFFVC